jgi:hypothetical protein
VVGRPCAARPARHPALHGRRLALSVILSVAFLAAFRIVVSSSVLGSFHSF